MDNKEQIKALLRPLATGIGQLSASFSAWTAEEKFNADDIKRRQILNEYRAQEAQEYYSNTRAVLLKKLEDLNFHVAKAALELVIEDWSAKKRLDGYHPSDSHQIDQIVEYVIGLTVPDMPLKQKRADIEVHHGSIEILITAKILHDEFENKGIFADTYGKRLEARIKKNMGLSEDQKLPHQQAKVLKDSLQSTELLTHIRKYTIEKFNNLTGANISFNKAQIRNLKQGGIIDLSNSQNDFFKDKITAPFDSKINLPIKRLSTYALWDSKKDRPIIQNTLYGSKNDPIADWHTNFNTMVQFPYVLATKLDDRASNLGTRFAMLAAGNETANFDLDSTRAYYESSRLLSETVSNGALAVRSKSVSQALEPFIRSSNASLGLLNSIATILVSHTPQYNSSVAKRLDHNSMNGQAFNILRFFDDKKRGDINVVHGNNGELANYYLSNDLYKIFQQVGDLTTKEMGFDHQYILNEMMNCVADEAQGSTREMIINVSDNVQEARQYVRDQMRPQLYP